MLTQPLSTIYSRSNQAVEINPPTGVDFHLTTHGSNWYWSVFSLFMLCTLLVIGFTFTKKQSERLFHYLTATALFIMSIQYFTQASDLGWTAVQAEFNHVTTDSQELVPGLRQIWYSRWVGYFLAFPIYLVSWAALVGASWSTAMFTVAAQEITIVSFLIGMLITSTYKWGYYTFGVVGFFLVVFNLWYSYRKSAEEEYTETLAKKASALFAGATVLLLLYPIAWALCEGGNVIQSDSEAVFYGVLDICFFLILGMYFHVTVEKEVIFEARGMTGFEGKVFGSQESAAPAITKV